MSAGIEIAPLSWEDTTCRRSVSPDEEGHLVDATFSHPSGRLGGIRRPQSRVVGRPGAGDGPGWEGSVARAGRRAVERADGQGSQPGLEDLLAGGGDGRRRRQHRGHVSAPAWRDGHGLRRRLRPLTLGWFLRSFTFGQVRQVDAVASRFLVNLAEHTGLFGSPDFTGTVLVDSMTPSSGTTSRARRSGTRSAGPERGAPVDRPAGSSGWRC